MLSHQQRQKHSQKPVSTVPLDQQNLKPPHETASKKRNIDTLEDENQEKFREASGVHNYQLGHKQPLSTEDRTVVVNAMPSHQQNQKPSQKLASKVPQNLESPQGPTSKKKKDRYFGG